MIENNNETNNLENTELKESEQIVNESDKIKNDSLKKQNKKKFWYSIIISLLVLVILLIGFFVIFKHFKNVNKISFEEKYELYQYFSGVKTNYEGKVTISLDGDITK